MVQQAVITSKGLEKNQLLAHVFDNDPKQRLS